MSKYYDDNVFDKSKMLITLLKNYNRYPELCENIEKNNIDLSDVQYVNFEDERLLEMTSDDLNTILEIGLEISGIDNKPYFFLDEIQNING